MLIRITQIFFFFSVILSCFAAGPYKNNMRQTQSGSASRGGRPPTGPASGPLRLLPMPFPPTTARIAAVGLPRTITLPQIQGLPDESPPHDLTRAEQQELLMCSNSREERRATSNAPPVPLQPQILHEWQTPMMLARMSYCSQDVIDAQRSSQTHMGDRGPSRHVQVQSRPPVERTTGHEIVNPNVQLIFAGGDGGSIPHFIVSAQRNEPDALYVAIEGTDFDSFASAMNDLNCFTKPLSSSFYFQGINANINVHRGFLGAFHRLAKPLYSALLQTCGRDPRRCRKIYISGHSLGGAIAELVGAGLYHNNFENVGTRYIKVLGIESPAVGNKPYADWYDTMSGNHQHFSWGRTGQRFQFAFITNRWDLVVRLPPWAWHPSGEVFRAPNARDNQLVVCPGQHNQACQSGNNIFEQLFATCVADHSGPINGISFGRAECTNRHNEHGQIPSFQGSHLREFFLPPVGFRYQPREFFTVNGGRLRKLPIIAPPNTRDGSPSSSKSSSSRESISSPRTPVSISSDSSGSSFPRGGGSWIGSPGSRHSSPGSTSSGERISPPTFSNRRPPAPPREQQSGGSGHSMSRFNRRMLYVKGHDEAE